MSAVIRLHVSPDCFHDGTKYPDVVSLLHSPWLDRISVSFGVVARSLCQATGRQVFSAAVLAGLSAAVLLF